jgi:hypothetical protein
MLMGKVVGYDGNAPEFRPARDIQAHDRLTGRIVRETPDGPENVNSTRIRAMHVRKRLTDRQAEAANRYQNDYQLSEMITVASSGMIRVSGACCGYALSDTRLDAMKRYGLARQALGPRYVRIVELVALDNILVEIAANMMQLDKRKAAERLECGLERLADHYGIGE